MKHSWQNSFPVAVLHESGNSPLPLEETREETQEDLTDKSSQVTSKQSRKSTDSLYLIGLVGLTFAILLLDLITKAGVAIGMLYVGVIVLTPAVSFRRAPYFFAGACTGLTVIGVILSPGVNILYSGSTIAAQATVNRLLSVIMIWMTAFLMVFIRQKTESALLLSAMVESSDDAIIGQTLEGKVTSWNKGAEHMFGYTEEESRGQLMTFIFPQDRIPEEETILAKLQKGVKIVNFETIRQRKDGRTIPVSLTISPVIDRWGRMRGASKIVRDITRQKKMEARLSAQNKELTRQATFLKQSNEDLEQFAYIASHDLQEPLRTIHGFTQLLEERYQHRFDDQAKEFMAFVTDATKRMQVIIQDLLKYSRVQSKELKPVPVQVEDILKEILQQLQIAIEEKAAKVTFDPLPVIHADEVHLRHVLQNLITNALKYHGPDPPEIHVSAQDLPHEWQLTVEDNGLGIDAEHYDRIFLPFKRLHNREEYEGTGIGLALCKRIVERQEGRIGVESEVGKGSRFFFTIPKIQNENS